PDLPALTVGERWIARVRGGQPELPVARRQRLQGLGLSAYDAGVLTAERSIADLFDETVKRGAPAKQAANWISSELLMRLNRGDALAVDAAALAELIALIEDGTISTKIAKDVFDKAWRTRRRPREIVEAEGLTQ